MHLAFLHICFLPQRHGTLWICGKKERWRHGKSDPLIASDWSQEKPTKTKIKPCQPLALLTHATIKVLPRLKSCNTVIGFILVLFGFRWFLIRSLQVYWSQEKPTKTKIKPCQPLTLLTHDTIKVLPRLKSCHDKVLQRCDRFYLGFIRFSLISYPLIASDWSQEKPSKTKIKPCYE